MRRKIFITLCSVLSAVFLTSYLFIFFLFRSVLFQEIRQQQINLQKYNETIFTSYIDSFSMVPFQLVNDEEIGELASTNNSSYLDMFRARELLRKKFNNYLNQQLFTSNLDCRILFYLNDTLPMDSYCDAYTLSEHVALRTCQVYSSRLVKDQEWYKRTEKITWSPYFFINKDTDELCYSKYVYNYALNSSSEGIGTVVIAIPENAFLEKISAGSITPNSRFFLSNEYQELLYASSEVSDSLFLSALSKSSGQILCDSTSHERYLVSTSSVNQDLFLTFLTPLSDIEQIVITALFPYILFVLIAFFLLICVLYLLSRKITEPIISLADLISTIEDTRTFQTQRFSVYHDAELQVLCHSFTALIQRENLLLDQIIEENRQKRTAMLHALQAQINPHFLYNTLDLISWKATANGDMETVDIVVKLARFYRLSLSNGSDFLPLSDEAEHVRLFVELTNLSRGRTVELITKIDPSIADYPIMKLILQPIVENSLFHGLYELDDRAGVICLSAERIGSYVQIRIQDNGIGMDKGKLTEILAKKDKPVVNTKRGGYGIGNILERLHIYYDDDFMFEIDSAILVGTTVTIRVPYSRNDSPQIHAERPIGGAEQN